MDAPTVAAIRGRFAEFAQRTDSEIAAAAAAALELSAVSEEATLHLAAHLLALSSERDGSPDGGAGEVSMEQTGGRIVHYVSMARTGDEVWWTTTPYGRIAHMLQSASPRYVLSPMVV